MPKHFILRIFIVDVGIPLLAGIVTWVAFDEPLTALLVTFAVVLLVLVIQIYIDNAINKDKHYSFPVLNQLVSNVNNLWHNNISNHLYQLLLIDKIDRFAKDISPTQFYGNQMEIQERGILLANNIKEKAFLTYLVNLQDYWDTINPYFEQTRIAARERRKDVTRLYICDSDSLNNLDFLRVISEDYINNIKTFIVIKEDVNDNEIIKDFGIWDGQVLCLVDREATTGKTVGCEYTTDETKLKNAFSWKERLMSHAVSPKQLLESRLPTIPENIRDIQESAPLVEKWSKECQSTFLGGDSCKWYHSSWQYLRLLDVVASPDWHHQFYKDTLTKFLNLNPKAKILISGVADYGMLSHVISASKSAQSTPDIYIIDSCQTPIRACNWYAKRHNIIIHTVCENLLTTKLRSSSFDLIVTDEFLTVVGKTTQQLVVKKWKELLKSKGKIVTTVMFENSGSEVTKLQEAKEQKEEYNKRILKRINEQTGLIWPKIAYKQIENMSQNYVLNMTNNAVSSEEEVKNLFIGFNLDLNKKSTPGEFICPGESFEICAGKI